MRYAVILSRNYAVGVFPFVLTLVPKLHLGTQLPRQLHCRWMRNNLVKRGMVASPETGVFSDHEWLEAGLGTRFRNGVAETFAFPNGVWERARKGASNCIVTAERSPPEADGVEGPRGATVTPFFSRVCDVRARLGIEHHHDSTGSFDCGLGPSLRMTAFATALILVPRI